MNKHTRTIVADILAVAAPEELLALPGYDPSKSPVPARAEGALGIGFEGAAVLLLPIVWKVVETILEDVLNEARRETAARLWGAMKGLATGGDNEKRNKVICAINNHLTAAGINVEQHPMLAGQIADAISKRAL